MDTLGRLDRRMRLRKYKGFSINQERRSVVTATASVLLREGVLSNPASVLILHFYKPNWGPKMTPFREVLPVAGTPSISSMGSKGGN